MEWKEWLLQSTYTNDLNYSFAQLDQELQEGTAKIMDKEIDEFEKFEEYNKTLEKNDYAYQKIKWEELSQLASENALIQPKKPWAKITFIKNDGKEWKEETIKEQFPKPADPYKIYGSKKADQDGSKPPRKPRYPAYKKSDRVNTPNGPGNVWSVDRDGTVCVELDSDPTILHEFEKKELKKIK